MLFIIELFIKPCISFTERCSAAQTATLAQSNRSLTPSPVGQTFKPSQFYKNSRKKYEFNSILFQSIIHFIQNLEEMTKMCQKLYSMIIFLLMTNSWPNSMGENVCDLISSDGKLSEFGLYKRFDTEGNPSYWLFARDDTNTNETKPEYELKFSFGADWNLIVSPNGVHMFPAIHKFSVMIITHYNCTVRRHVSPFICFENNFTSYEFQIFRQQVFKRNV